jgi:hypothetical protein
MVWLPIVAENWLDGDQPSDDVSVAPVDSGGGSAGDAGPEHPIGPVQGYPEDGKHAWRAANDDTIVAAVDKYNSGHQYYPGDAEYMTPQLMKSWMMQESGGSPDAFKTDPFQVNNPGDWDPAKANKNFAGLSQGQIMTPETSADAALKWLHYKGRIDTSENSPNRGRWVPYQGHYEALRNYNAAAGPVPGVPKGADYANSVLNKAWASYGDWQQ